MTTRRQSSTTSLRKYAHQNDPDLSSRSLDFCNAFWGASDAGVEVLFARMRGAMRTMEELTAFWKERTAIEEEYAKKLAKLAKLNLGRDEIGELRNCLDTVRLETDKQAAFHLQLAQQIHNELESQTNTFHLRQVHHKKNYQTYIEKQFKAKQNQESHVNKAREKYESDCLRINSYTAQSTLVQGKELEKLHLKLERAQQTVQANERDYTNFAKALAEFTQKWEVDWKSFCDSCQDLEEERIGFMKDNMWAYANAVSTVCVSDDESCERLRLCLEQVAPERDMENFVRDYGTGPLIPDPPAFVNFSDPDAAPAPSRVATRTAQFKRVTQRTSPQWTEPPAPPVPDDGPVQNNIAGRGSGGGAGAHVEPGDIAQPPAPVVNGQDYHRPPVTASPIMVPANNPMPRAPGEGADPGALSDTYIRQQQQQQQGGSGPIPQAEVDPLEKQMKALETPPPSGATRRNSVWKRGGGPSGTDGAPGPQPRPVSASDEPLLSIGNELVRDYNTLAQDIVGAHPSSRPPSPAAPAPPPHTRSRSNSRANNAPPAVTQAPPANAGSGSKSPANKFVAPPGTGPGPGTSPTSKIGVTIGPGGEVVEDDLATRYRQQQYSRHPPLGGNSYAPGGAPPRWPNQDPPPSVSPTQGIGIVYHPGYNPVQPPQLAGYPQGPAPSIAPPNQPTPYGPPPQQPNHSQGYLPSSGPNVNGVPVRRDPAYPQQIYQPPAPPQGPQYVRGYPSQTPQQAFTPTGQSTEDGRGILFYVKALYDYQATVDEEFDFQSGDIIAVTATPEDGWWSGELLDEARRQPGRNVFPSNFVCLF